MAHVNSDLTAATVTVEKRDGEWWWHVSDYMGEFESGCPSKQAAVAHGRLVVESHGYGRDDYEVRA